MSDKPSEALAVAVSADDTRTFVVSLADLTNAYRTALEADIDPVSAMWMAISMDCANSAALIRDAEARGMERAADHVVATCPTGMDAADLIDAHHDIAAAIRAEAAAIRGDTE
jgi:hypothetical protein